MSVPGNFMRDIGKHINKRHDLQRGDKEAWAEWFDRLEFFANLSDSIGKGMDETVDALDTALDWWTATAVITTREQPIIDDLNATLARALGND